MIDEAILIKAIDKSPLHFLQKQKLLKEIGVHLPDGRYEITLTHQELQYLAYLIGPMKIDQATEIYQNGFEYQDSRYGPFCFNDEGYKIYNKITSKLDEIGKNEVS